MMDYKINRMKIYNVNYKIKKIQNLYKQLATIINQNYIKNVKQLKLKLIKMELIKNKIK